MKLVIKQHRPLRRALILAGAGVAGLMAIAIALDYGHWQSIARAMVSSGNKGTLLEDVSRLKDENAALEFEITRLRRAEQIAKFTHQSNQEQLVELQSEVASLNRELEFYRDVVGATEVESGPKIKGIQVKSLDDEQRYSYRLVLTHVDKNDRIAEGRLKIGLRGDLKGEHKALSFAEVVETGPEVLSFKFKHFRLFEGTIKLPDGFVPRQISVAVQSNMRAAGNISETYDWASVLN